MSAAEQRRRALRVGNGTRQAMATYKQSLAAGDITLLEAVRVCDLPLTVIDLLTAAPRIGASRALSLIERADLISADLRMAPSRIPTALRQISPTERTRLLEVIRDPNKNFRQERLAPLNNYQRIAVKSRMDRAGCTHQQIAEVLAA